MRIKYALHLVGADDSFPLSGAALFLAGGIQINCNNRHCAIRLYPERHKNDSLSLAEASDALPLSGSALTISGSTQINNNDINHAIHLDPLLNLYNLDGKQNAKGI